MTTTKIVHKGDLAITRRLGAKYLRTCKVAEWRQKRGGFSEPRAWLVPLSVLDQYGLTPLSRIEVEATTEQRRQKSHATRSQRLQVAATTLGSLPEGRITRAYLAGQVDQDSARLLAFQAAYRHNHTDYDQLCRQHGRDDARALRADSEVPATWDRYRARYDLLSDAARALAAVLKDPKDAHPCWFKEAEIAVERAGLDLPSLTYEKVADAIALWRSERDS